MKNIQLYTKDIIEKFFSRRADETRLGERVDFCRAASFAESLSLSNANYVLIGAPEDIGVRANLGRPGAAGCWEQALRAILSIQSNAYLEGSEIMVAGHIDFSDLEARAGKNELNVLRELTREIDERVSAAVELIASAGKETILIGGGHNNSYGCIKGVSRAAGKPLHVINADPHSDFRKAEGRHSGNGFRYAMDEGYLGKYAIFGLQENYSPQAVTEDLRGDERISFSTYESIFIRKESGFEEALQKEIAFVSGGISGIEIDLDAIENMPSSAVTPSGLSAAEARRYIHLAASSLDTKYLHIAEGAPALGSGNTVGKMTAFLMSDYIKARNKLN